ncbi:hypothetical protein, partial [Flavobacterium psychrophilum]|uniref:hypothetical protein n=2 Tax=Flavobacterium psychrophilum TaxID=96345 RepID=UPI0036FEEFFA
CLSLKNRNTEDNMFDNLDELIQLNLNLLCEKKSKSIMHLEFKDEKGKQFRESEKFAKILDQKGLVCIEKVQGFRCDLTEFGYIVFTNGGWLKYLESEKLKSEKAESKGVLEFENLKLQKESSEHSKTLRQKEDEIRDLTRDNLRLGNWDIRFRWYIAVGGFIFGFITKYFMDK